MIVKNSGNTFKKLFFEVIKKAETRSDNIILLKTIHYKNRHGKLRIENAANCPEIRGRYEVLGHDLCEITNISTPTFRSGTSQSSAINPGACRFSCTRCRRL